MKNFTKSASSTGNLRQSEKQVLVHMSEGLSTVQIAHAVKLSALTIETHRKSIMRKLKAPNAVGAVAMAIRLKLID